MIQIRKSKKKLKLIDITKKKTNSECQIFIAIVWVLFDAMTITFVKPFVSWRTYSRKLALSSLFPGSLGTLTIVAAILSASLSSLQLLKMIFLNSFAIYSFMAVLKSIFFFLFRSIWSRLAWFFSGLNLIKGLNNL